MKNEERKDSKCPFTALEILEGFKKGKHYLLPEPAPGVVHVLCEALNGALELIKLADECLPKKHYQCEDWFYSCPRDGADESDMLPEFDKCDKYEYLDQDDKCDCGFREAQAWRKLCKDRKVLS